MSVVGSQIMGVFVRAQFQGRGYGRAIMSRLEQIAARRKVPKLELSVSLPSRRFYERLGYTIIEERVLDVGEGQDLRYFLAEKPLPG